MKNYMSSSSEISLVKDKFLMEQSRDIVIKLIECNININEITRYVKDYQKKYLFIKQTNPEQLSLYTSLVWWQSSYDEKLGFRFVKI